MPAADSPLEFPCLFPIKVMGNAADDFDALVMEIVGRHIESITPDAVQRRASKEGRYLSLTITIKARSQAQLDAVYRDLSGHARVLLVL